MALHISFHSNNYGDTATNSRGGALDILGPLEGNAQAVAVGGSAANSTVSDGSYLMKMTPEEACRIAIGNGATATANSEYFAAGIPEVRAIKTGERVSVIAV